MLPPAKKKEAALQSAGDLKNMKRMHGTNGQYMAVYPDTNKIYQFGIPIYAKLADGSVVPMSTPDYRMIYARNKDFKDGKMVFSRATNDPTQKHSVAFGQDVSAVVDLLVDARMNFSVDLDELPVFTIRNVDPAGKTDWNLATDKTKRVMIVDSKDGQFRCLGAFDENSKDQTLPQDINVEEPRSNFNDVSEQAISWYEKFGVEYYDEDDEDSYIRLPKTLNGVKLWEPLASNNTQIMVSDCIYPEKLFHKMRYSLYIIPADCVEFSPTSPN